MHEYSVIINSTSSIFSFVTPYLLLQLYLDTDFNQENHVNSLKRRESLNYLFIS